MKAFIQNGNPFEDITISGEFLFFPWGKCAASWITPATVDYGGCLASFQLDFTADEESELVLHASADEHYELLLDGELFGRGPISGSLDCWFYDSYRGTIGTGPHRLQANVFFWGRRWMDTKPDWRIPDFRMSKQMAFFLAAEGPWHEALSTGTGKWRCRVLPVERKPSWSVVPDCRLRPLNALEMAPEVEVLNLGNARCRDTANEYTMQPLLAPSPLPPMYLHKIVPLVYGDQPQEWQTMLKGSRTVILSPQEKYRILLNFPNYVCAWMEMELDGGAGTVISSQWAEAAFLPDGTKGQRDFLEGKSIVGLGDDFLPDGSQGQVFRSTFWRAGRLLELQIATGEQELRLRRLDFQETHYPLEKASSFECDEPRVQVLNDLFFHTLEMCSHDTFMDCPYYERLQYSGDTRLQALGTYAFSRDDRLVQQALRMMADGRAVTGLTLSRYPCEVSQIIPSFSLLLVCMAHDNALWRGNADLHRSLLPRWREIAGYFHQCLNGDGVVQSPYGWNFLDWCHGWPKGYPPNTENKASGLLSLIFEMALNCLASLEAYVGEPEMQAMYGRWAEDLHRGILKCFYDDATGLFYDDLEHQSLSEHAQALAVLTGRLNGEQLAKVRANLLAGHGRLTACTVSFSHYLFEAMRILKCPELFQERLQLWYGFIELGFATVPEQPEPSRSDCHAWGVHPYYHFLMTGLGIRPLGFGFKQVQVSPLPLWNRMKGVLPHPQGDIAVDFQPGQCTITLPAGVAGCFEFSGKKREIPGDGQEHRFTWQTAEQGTL